MKSRNRIRTSSIIQKRAKELRQEMTVWEVRLWKKLRNRNICGVKFRRQHPIGPYIVDFFCPKNQLIIELDGGHHNQQKEYDAERKLYLENQGYKIIRFWNREIDEDIEVVMQ